MGRFSSVVALQLHEELESWARFPLQPTITVGPGLTLLLGDKDIWMVLVTLVSLTWLGLDWLVSLLCLETQAELDLLIRKGSLQKGTVALHKGCIVSGSY